MGISPIVTMGFGTFADVHLLPTLGYAGVAVIPEPAQICLDLPTRSPTLDLPVRS
jgi:hypothetical protein